MTNNIEYKKKYLKYKKKYLELKKTNNKDSEGGGWGNLATSAMNFTKSNPTVAAGIF